MRDVNTDGALSPAPANIVNTMDRWKCEVRKKYKQSVNMSATARLSCGEIVITMTEISAISLL